MIDAPPQSKTWLNGLLFVLTVLSTFFVGLVRGARYLYFEAWTSSGTAALAVSGQALGDPRVVVLSFLYAAALMAILVGHELGHYLTCRRYGVLATLPYFIPAPTLIGTFGAFIRIKSPITRKHQLFDIGANGPFIGFLLAFPALVIGLAFSRISTHIPTGDVITFGEPLLFKLLSALFFGGAPEGSALVLHPVGFAGRVGILVTSFNLIPLGQLDGGHIAYALIGRRARLVSKGVIVLFAVMGVLFWAGWFVWAAVILFFELKSKLGLRHPPVLDEDAPLDPGRKVRGVLIVLIFVLSFIPDPVKGFSLLSLFKGLTGG